MKINLDSEVDLIFERKTLLTPQQIWQGWTDETTLKKWFCPRPWKVADCRLNLEVGGEFFTEMHGPNGEKAPGSGCYLVIEPLKRLAWTNFMTAGFKPSEIQHPGFGFVGIIDIEKQDSHTLYKATVRHANSAGRSSHEQMGFQEGWGAAFTQLEELFLK